MGRTATPAQEPVNANINEERVADTDAAAAALVVAQRAYTEGRDLVNQILGQAQMADTFAKLSKTVFTSKLAFVKENKLYRQLAGRIFPHGAEKTLGLPRVEDAIFPHGAEKLRGTWDEFCGLLGRSVDQVDRDIANLRAFGEEALDAMSTMGIGYRELRQYRRLPADEQQALIEMAKEGDKDGFLDLAETLVARHHAEKESLTAQVEDLRGDLDAARERVTAKQRQIDRLEEARHRIKRLPADRQIDALRREASDIAADALCRLRGDLRAALQVLKAEDPDSSVFAAGLVGELVRELHGLRQQFNLPDASDLSEREAMADVAEWAAPFLQRKAQEAATEAAAQPAE